MPVQADLVERIANAVKSMTSALRAKGEFFAQRLDHISDGLAASLALSGAERRLERISTAISAALAMRMQSETARVERLADRLRLLSPYGVLDRGYSLTTAEGGSVVRDASSLHSGMRITTRFANSLPNSN